MDNCNDRHEALLQRLYTKLKSQAKSRNKDVSITLEEFSVLVALPCHYCGNLPANVIKDRFKKNNKQFSNPKIFLIYSGIDRKDNTKGYSLNNVLPCCKVCNAAKLDLTYEDFKNHIAKIYRRVCLE